MKFKLPTGKFYTTGIKVLLAYIIIILIASVYESQRVIKTGKRITNNQEIVQHSKQILVLALNIESSFRGYILTGKKTFLGTLEKSQKEINDELAALKKLTVNIPAHKINSDPLLFHVNNRIVFSNHNIANYETNGANAAMKIVETGEGKLYTDRIRFLTDKIQDTANVLQVEYKDANEKAFRNLQLVLLLVIVGIVLLLAGFIRKIKAESVEKEKTAAALKKINDELEERVIERTQKIIKTSRLYFFISQINQMIGHTTDEATLFKEACHIAVNVGKFRMAWIGMVDERTKKLVPVMHAGEDGDYPPIISGDSAATDTVLREGKYTLCNDIKKEQPMAPWKKETISRGYHSCMLLPIKKSGTVVGIFSLYSEVKDFFDTDEIALLEEATDNISFALGVFEKDNLRKTAIDRYDILAQATSDTIWDWDIANNTMLYNDNITKMFGYKAAEIENVVDWWNEKLYPDDFKKVTEMVEEVFEKGLQKFQLTYRFRCADGSYKYIFDRAYVMFDENNNPCRMIGAMQDISSRMEEEMRTSKAIINTQEQERQYIGAELHDNVNQILASSLLVLGMIKNEKMKIKEALEFIDTGKGYINNAIEELRKLSHELAPASFDNRSLKDAFVNLLMTFNLNKQFDIKLDFDEQCNALNGEIQLNLYRIMQEQIKNIVKYSAASKIEVDVIQSNGSVNMRIFDNGKGFNVKAAKNGIGLSNIKKRAESFSGKFILNSAPGKGCEIIVAIPRGI